MPTCPTCHEQVYHAEQVMGPQRQMYHKPCLVCVNCKTRVDPGGLQEHAGEAYCRNCHRMLFSPRDLRSANVYNSPSHTSPSTPTRQPAYHHPISPSYSTPTKPRTTPSEPPDELGNAEKSPTKGLISVDDLISDQARLNINSSSRERRGEVAQEEQEASQGYVPFRVIPRSSVRPSQARPRVEKDSPDDLPFQREDRIAPTPSSSSTSDMSVSQPFGGENKPGPPKVRPKPSDLSSGRMSALPSSSRSAVGAGMSTSLVEAEGSSPGQVPIEGTKTSGDPTIVPGVKNDEAIITDSHSHASLSTSHRPLGSTSTPSRTNWIPPKTQLNHPAIHGTPKTPGGATRTTTTGDTCPSCEKRVYLMEAVTALSRKWHKGCLKCVECRSTLDPNKLCDRESKVYCRKCYQNLFGPIGIR